jgi:hypothetical protein
MLPCSAVGQHLTTEGDTRAGEVLKADAVTHVIDNEKRFDLTVKALLSKHF